VTRSARSLALAAVLVAAACSKSEPDTWKAPTEGVVPGPARAPRGSGAELMAEFECSRCHDGTGVPTAALAKDCRGCHREILYGQPVAEPLTLAGWRGRIRHFVEVPSLAFAAQKFRRSWLERYLLEPHDLRPALEESMPRLALTPAQAAALSSYLAAEDAEMAELTPPSEALLAHGRKLLDTKGCGTCHRMSGVAALQPSPLPYRLPQDRMLRALRLAPDLRFARERLRPGYLARWLKDPRAAAADALMPNPELTPEEVRAISAYLLAAPLTPVTTKPFTRLPLLTRRVPFAEVQERVFRNTCWHCHSEPDYAIGDGGPGNTGGFGFPGKRINLAQHEGLLAGYADGSGERKSLFLPEKPSGDSRLVTALLARHAEEAGAPVQGVRGMPLALPALPAEEIQLVESWIAQGRPL
jgi:cytochrome c1